MNYRRFPLHLPSSDGRNRRHLVIHQSPRIQNELRRDGDEMAVRDLLIAATARSTGAELVVTDADFETSYLQGFVDVTNLTV